VHRVSEVRPRQPARPDGGAGGYPGIGAEVRDQQRFAGRQHNAGEAVPDRGVGDLLPRQDRAPAAVPAQPLAVDHLDQAARRAGGAGGERGKLVGGAVRERVAATSRVQGETTGRGARRVSRRPGTGAGVFSPHPTSRSTA
jgi:hypothetical protein